MLCLKMLIVFMIFKVADSDYWSDWYPWGSCSKTCGYGISYRYRNTYYKTGGIYCSSGFITVPRESKSCFIQNCPVGGNWGSWSSTGICSSSCGGGVSPMVRQCNNPRPSYGGQYCSGSNVKYSNCNTHNCPVDGQWSDWGNWTVCNTTCGDGYQNRSRECDNPKPVYGGSYCPDSGFHIRQCSVATCKISALEDKGHATSAVVGIAISSALFSAFIVTILHFIVNRKRKSCKESNTQNQAIIYNATHEGTMKSKAFDNKEYCSSPTSKRIKNTDQPGTTKKSTKTITSIYENLKF